MTDLMAEARAIMGDGFDPAPAPPTPLSLVAIDEPESATVPSFPASPPSRRELVLSYLKASPVEQQARLEAARPLLPPEYMVLQPPPEPASESPTGEPEDGWRRFLPWRWLLVRQARTIHRQKRELADFDQQLAALERNQAQLAAYVAAAYGIEP